MAWVGQAWHGNAWQAWQAWRGLDEKGEPSMKGIAPPRRMLDRQWNGFSIVQMEVLVEALRQFAEKRALDDNYGKHASWLLECLETQLSILKTAGLSLPA